MKAFIFPILLQLIGFAVIMAEIFIPSLGLLGAIAFGIFAYSLYSVYTSISINAGMIFTGLDIVFIPVLIIMGMKMLARSPLSLQRKLSKQDGVVSQDEKFNAYIQMEGKSVTDLRPSGTAIVQSHRLDVVTDGEYIESGTPVVVTDVTGNRIVVEKIK